MYKLRSDLFLLGYRHSLWIDATSVLKKDPRGLLPFLYGRSIAVFRHPGRRCVYQEAEAVVAQGKADPGSVQNQMLAYSADGYPEMAGLAAGGIILRENDDEVARFNNRWWQELVTSCNHRDQLCLDYAAWKEKVRYAVIPGHLRHNEWVDFKQHRCTSKGRGYQDG